MPEGHVRRRRLVARLLSGRVGVIEAAAGYGKTTLLSEFAQAVGLPSVYLGFEEADSDLSVMTGSLGRALRAAGLPALAATMQVQVPSERVDALLDALSRTPSGLMVLLDDVHLVAGADAQNALRRLAHGIGPPHRLVLATRRVAPAWYGPLGSAGNVLLCTQDLALTAAEVTTLAARWGESSLGPEEVARLTSATGGWVTAVLLALAVRTGGLTRPGESGTGASPRPADLIAPLVERLLEHLDPADRHLLGQLARLPLLSADLIDSLCGGPGGFDRLVAAGVPFVRLPTGTWELPGPVVDHLTASAPRLSVSAGARAGSERLAASTARTAAEHCRRWGEPALAVQVLLQAGLGPDAARFLAGLSPSGIDELGVRTMSEFVDLLGEREVARRPSVLVHLARTAGTSNRADIRSAALDRARRVLLDRGAGGGPADQVLAREIDAERARDLMWDERTRQEAGRLAAGVVASAAETELAARARALEVLGRLASWFSTDGPRAEAEQWLRRSASASRRLGVPVWEAQALTALAMGYYYANGRYEQALTTLEDALRALPAASSYRAGVLSFRADVLAELGRFVDVEACLAEMRMLGRLLREEWILAYACWSHMVAASFAGDAGATVDAAAAALAHRDAWFDQPSGTEFLVQAADALSRVGEHAKAWEYLAKARLRRGSNEKEVAVHEASVLARSGDPGEAVTVIAGVLGRADINPHERWPLLLLKAYALSRAGDAAAAAATVEALQASTDLGHPSGPMLREGRLLAELLPVAAAESAMARQLLIRSERLTVTVLGGFALRMGGRPAVVPPGRPSLAVRVVAAAGGRIRIGDLISILWPDADLDIGRNRLRNLLARVHAGGEILVRDGDTVAFPPGADIDAARFEADARRALRELRDPHAAAGLSRARAALSRYSGDLLPGDAAEEWVEPQRERLRSLCLQLLDLLASGAQRQGDVDEAIRLLQRGIDIQPHDENRYLRAARLLVQQHRVGSARQVLAAGRMALRDLDLVPSPEYAAVEHAVGLGR